MRCAAVLFALLLDGIEGAQAGIACRREDHIGAFSDLGQRKFFSFTRIVPRTVSISNIVLDDANVWIDGFRAFRITLGETMNQTNIHPAEKTDCACSRSFGGEYADKIRAFMLLENQGCNVRQFAYTIDDCELNVGVVFRNLLHDRRLCETDADDQIELAFGESAHRRLDGVGRARLNVAQDDRQILCGTLHSFPCGSIEGAIVFSADIENNPDVNPGGVVCCGARATAAEEQSCYQKQWQ